jgi:tetratricopeptide (TPR) repeat protein
MSPDHPHVLLCMGNLATAYLDVGATDRALPLLEEVAQTRKARMGDEDPATLQAMSNLASGYQAAGKPDRARPLFEEVLRLRKARLSPDHPDILAGLNNLAGAYRATKEPGRAEALYREAAVGVERMRFRHPGAGQIVHNLIDSLEQSERFDDAEAWRMKWLAVVRERSGIDSHPHAEELAGLGANLIRQGKLPAAETALREALGLLEKKAPETLLRFEVQSRLGEALLEQRRYVDAEPLLLGAFEGIEVREGHLPPAERRRLVESGRRIVRLYEAWGHAEKAAAWRSKLVTSGGVVERKP